MAESVACPDCQARLELPVLSSGQTVQCPRCARVFEPTPVHAAPRMVSRAVSLPDAVESEPPRLPAPLPLSGVWKPTAAMIALLASLLSYALQFYVNFEHHELIRRDMEAQRRPFQLGIDIGGNLEPIDRVRDDLWDDWQRLSDTANSIHHLTFWPAAILFLIWVHQAATNVWNLRASGLQFSPSATLSFLVPLLNLVWPYYMMQEIWRASHPRATADPLAWKEVSPSWAVRFWLWSYLAAAALLVFSSFLETDRFDPSALRLHAFFACIANVCVIAVAALMIYIIRGIQLRQNERHARLCEEAE